MPAPELQRSFRRLVLLYHLGRQICIQTREDQVFQSILDAATRLLDAERAFVGVVEEGRLVPRAVRQPSADGPPAHWPLSRTLLQRVLDEGVAALTTDAQREAPGGRGLRELE